MTEPPAIKSALPNRAWAPGPIVGLVTFSAAIIIGTIACIAYELWRTHGAALEQATQQTQNLVRVLDEHTAQTIKRVDLALLSVIDSLGTFRGAKFPDRERMRSLLLSKIPGDGAIRGFIVVDANGIGVGDTMAEPPLSPLAHRDYYIAHRDNPHLGLHVSPPIVSARTGRHFIGVSRRLPEPGGGFAGVVVVVIEPDYFQNFYNSLNVGPAGNVGMALRDGTLLVSAPRDESLVGRSLADTPMMQHHLWDSPIGSLRQVFSSTDGIERITSYRAIPELPLVVYVAIATSDALAEWRTNAMVEGSGGAAVIVIVMLLAAALSRQVQRLQQSQRSLGASESRYNILVANVPGVVYQRHMAPDGRLAYPWVSAGVTAVYGYEPNEVVADPSLFLNGIFEEDRAAYQDAVARSIAGMTALTWEGRIYTKDKSLKWIQVLSQPRRVEDGGIMWEGIILDATARKTAELALAGVQRELEWKSAQLETALTHMAQGLCVFDSDQRLLLLNQRYLELYNLPADRVRPGTTTLRELMEISAEIGNYPADVARRVTDERLSIVRANRRRVFVQRLQNGRVIEGRHEPLPSGGFVSTYTDVTQREAATLTLRQTKETAELADRAKSEFLANMSHELRTPLNAIIGFSEIMQHEMFGPVGDRRYRDYANDIHSSGTHLLNLISDILDLSKIEAGKLELHEEPLSLADVVATCVSLVRERAGNAGIRVVVEPTDHLPRLSADETKMKQILLNLLSNAIKFTPNGGRVTVGAHRANDHSLVIFVTDTGIGMRAEDIPIAMQPFRQIENAITRKHAGTGLGLPLTKSLVELHGGVMMIESQPNVGTTVTIRLPPSRLLAPAESRRASAG
ncbi:MAG: PAS-domain containing protein [Proteobacteria bacterium]|nr:PAS-domain containing protein [Pseudomonadota bacterium]